MDTYCFSRDSYYYYEMLAPIAQPLIAQKSSSGTHAQWTCLVKSYSGILKIIQNGRNPIIDIANIFLLSLLQMVPGP